MLFSVYTLGCKLNQLETEAVADSFRREGFSLVPWGEAGLQPPAMLLINTCTVTSMADQKARRLIRKALRECPETCLIVTGCYAQMEKAALAALEAEISSEPRNGPAAARAPESGSGGSCARRLFIVPGEMKDRLLDLPAFLAQSGALFDDGPGEPVPPPAAGEIPGRPLLPGLIAAWLDSLAPGEEGEGGSFRFAPASFSSHSRGFLKIQDGCDRRCAYCRVSLARGKSRSLAAEKALAELQSLEKRGFSEAVLTGVNIVQYRDARTAPGMPGSAPARPAEAAEKPGMGLPGLLDFLLRGTSTIRIRLSSLEPDGLTDDFIEVLEHPRIRPHFHLSAQSGSPGILAKMGRPYGPADIERAAALFRSVKPDPFLAADIIAGFPGETEGEFEKTLELCRRIGFSWIHAFPFSPRPGTAAYRFSEKPSEKDAAGRVEALTDLAAKGRREYVRRWEGREVEAVAEAGNARDAVPGVSENYLRLLISCGSERPAPGTLVRCRILSSGAFGSEKRGNSAQSGAGGGPGFARFDAPAEKIG